MHKHQKELHHRPTKRKELVPILSDIKVGLREEQSKI